MPVLRSVERSRGRGSRVNDRPRAILLTIKIPTPAASSTKPTTRSQVSTPGGQRGPTTAHATIARMTIDCRTTQPSPRRPSAGGSTARCYALLGAGVVGVEESPLSGLCVGCQVPLGLVDHLERRTHAPREREQGDAGREAHGRVGVAKVVDPPRGPLVRVDESGALHGWDPLPRPEVVQIHVAALAAEKTSGTSRRRGTFSEGV